MLEDLSKRDLEWRRIALKICGCKNLADDLTNDMYIQVYEVRDQYKEINEWFVFRVIKNLYLHYLRNKKKTGYIDEVSKVKLAVLSAPIKCEVLEDRIMVNEALKQLDWMKQQYLLHRHEGSLRKKGEELNISYRTIQYQSDKALKELKLIINPK